jgi:hypothetical protein
MSEPLAWFELYDESCVERFKRLVESEHAVYEGHGEKFGDIEGYAIFKSRKKMESFAAKMKKLKIGQLLGFVF